jgi:hypothetical protein
MPFTPFHLGPGAVFKAIGGKHFSFMVFGGSQVLIDIEPGLGLIYGWPVLHGWTHTIPGALAIGAIAGVIGRPISEFVLRLLRIGYPPFTWTASFAGAFLGTFSHIALDALMHADIAPWRPFTAANPWYGLLSMEAVYRGCLVVGLVAAAIVAARGLMPHSQRR